MEVRLKNISKSYSGNLVLNNVSLKVNKGQIHALVGENGAGKSTLMKILIGVEKADDGEIVVNDTTRIWRNPIDARNAGIAMVFKELSLIPTLTVFENVFLDRLLRNQWCFVNWSEIKKCVETIFGVSKLDSGNIKIIEYGFLNFNF